MSAQRCIIIGAGHAAAQLVPGLRQEGWTGDIVLLGEEPYLPYNRPPLSKTFLSGDKSVDQLLIRPAPSYEKAGVECRLGVRAVQIDRDDKTLQLDSGDTLDYDRLALAMGSRVRKVDLPGADLGGIFYLRNVEDVQAIRRHTAADKRAVIVGGGYIGLETAAMLRGIGMQVTVLEMSERVLNRVTAPQVSAIFARIHEEEGVEIVSGVTVAGFEGDGEVRAVTCADGSRFAADLVVLGIGVVPNDELAAAAGLTVDDGIVVDSLCRSSDPSIVAAGDCTRFFSPHYQRYLRLESVQNAVDQAKVAAATACGGSKEYNALPWFWSDQYDMKLQIAGLSEGYDTLVMREGSQGGRKFAAFYLKDNKLIAVDAVNSPQEFMLGKRMIAAGVEPDKNGLADAGVPMRELLKGQ